MNTIQLLISTDCEATQHAINDAPLGERATRGLQTILAENQMNGTFFVIPGDLQTHGPLYRELTQQHHEVGLHLHPADLGYQEFIGVYSADMQRKIIDEAADQFAQVMGHRPQSICMGYNSANDHTFPVLVELGFQHGHMSTPGRILPECASMWAGAPLDIHYAHAHNRLLAGTLDFVEIPQTLDPDSRMWGGKHPQDLRVELVDAKNHWYTMAKSIDRQLKSQSALPYIHIVTHNTFDYSDPANFRHQTLQDMIRHAKQYIESKQATFDSLTLAACAQKFRDQNSLEDAKEKQLVLDTRGRG